jgi:hypothetical protein
MKKMKERGAVAAVVTLAAFAGADAAGAAVMRGTVVHRNARAHSFALANRSGRLFAIHTKRAPRIGTQLQVTARRLLDGTFALQRARVVGRAHPRVSVRGVVSHVGAGAFTLSAPGVSMLVRMHRRARAADASGVPAVGSEVTVTGTLDDQGDLDEQSATTTGSSTGGFSLEGAILSVDATARTLSVSADDDDNSAGTVTVSVPAAIDISQFQPGQEVELEVQRQADGTLVLLGSADDENAQRANTGDDQQGDGGDGEDRGRSGHDGGSGGDGGSGSGSSAGSGSSEDGGDGGSGGGGSGD